MKKTYMKPALDVVKIQTTGMLATSSMGVSNETPTEWGGAPSFFFDDTDESFALSSELF